MLEARLVTDYVKMTYWVRFLSMPISIIFNYGGIAALGLHKYQDNSGVVPCYQ